MLDLYPIAERRRKRRWSKSWDEARNVRGGITWERVKNETIVKQKWEK